MMIEILDSFFEEQHKKINELMDDLDIKLNADDLRVYFLGILKNESDKNPDKYKIGADSIMCLTEKEIAQAKKGFGIIEDASGPISCFYVLSDIYQKSSDVKEKIHCIQGMAEAFGMCMGAAMFQVGRKQKAKKSANAGAKNDAKKRAAVLDYMRQIEGYDGMSAEELAGQIMGKPGTPSGFRTIADTIRDYRKSVVCVANCT